MQLLTGNLLASLEGLINMSLLMNFQKALNLDWQNMDIYTTRILVFKITATYIWEFLAALISTKVYSADLFSFKMDSSSMLPQITWFWSCPNLKSQYGTSIGCLAPIHLSWEALMKMITWPKRVCKIKRSKPWSREFLRARTLKSTIIKAL